MIVIFAALLASAGGCGGSMRGDGAFRQLAPQLPVTRVTLYQNGVGYFERQGKLDGNVLTLHCRPSQINDLLKSLTVIDRGSGRAVSVSLPLERHGAKLLAELPKQVRHASGLLDVLRVFRGARVRVHGSQGTVEGRVVGVEQGLLALGAKPVKGWRVTLKNKRGQLVVYPVARVRRLQMLDSALAVGLKKSLDVSLEEGTWKPITLSVRLAGDKPHDLLVSYIVEMPMWKPAYRLVLPDGGRKPLLQGWAVVDNMSGESWRDVQLSLVAGTPMSFLYDLHSPRFARRIDLTPRGQRTALAPPSATPGYGPRDKTKDEAERRAAPARRARRRSWRRKKRPRTSAKLGSRGAGGGASAQSLNRLLERQARAKVKVQKVGNLFRYDLDDPVTVPDASSTLVNIVNARVDGEGVVLFRPELTSSYAASHPYRAVRFTNNTGFALEKGPVAIYAGGTFVGEGFVEQMEKGQTLFITYSVDNSITMRRSTRRAYQPVKLLKIHGGQIVSEVLNIYRESYKITNNSERAVVAYVKSRQRSGAELRNAPKRTVRTANAAFVPISVAAGKSATLRVEWVTPVRRWLGIDTAMATTVLKMFVGGGQVPAAVKPLLQKILKAKQRMNAIDEERTRLSKLRATLTKDQARVRENLKLLRKVKGNARLRATVTRNLAKLENQLSKITAKYVKLDSERAQLRSKVRIWIGQISLDNAQK